MFELEHQVRKADGSVGWVFSRAIPLLNKNGEIVEWFGAASDITERKHAEEALRESEEKYRLIVETAGEGIFIARPEGNYLYANRRMADLLGLQVEEILGKSSLDFAFDDNRDQVYQARRDLHNGHKVHGEFRFRHKDGSLVWTMYNATPIFNDKGEHVSNISMFTDITEFKRAEEELWKSEKRFRAMFEGHGAPMLLIEPNSG